MANKQFNVKAQYGSEASAYGTKAATFNEFARFQTFTPTMNNNLHTLRSTASGRNPTGFVFGNFDASFSATWELIDFDVLKHFIGPISGAGTTASPYVLTESSIIGVTAATDILPFSLEIASDESTDDVDVYLGCVGRDWEISGELGAPVMMSANGVAKTVDSNDSISSYTEPTTPSFMVWQSTVQFGTSPSTVADVRSFKVGMSNNLVEFRGVGSRFLSKPEPGVRDYTWELTVVMTTTVETEFRDVFYGASSVPSTDTSPASNIELKLVIEEGTSSGDRRAYVWLDGVVIDSISKPLQVGNDLVLLTATGKAKEGKSNAPVSWWTVT